GLVVAAVTAGAAAAGPLEDGNAAYGRGDYATALQRWEPLADHGVALAQTSLGYMYDAGKGVPRDYVKAAKWYRLAAEQDEVFAQDNLGELYEHGHGVLPDYA